MTKSFSLYLDFIRFTAAFMVFVDHLASYGFVTDAVAYFIPQLGREAVIIFFILSGYVIAFTTDTRNPDAKSYFIARASRILSVALPLLLIAFALTFVLSHILLIDVPGDYQLNKIYIYLPLHLGFFGEFWNISLVPPLLVTYWSLHYEVWYYILFGVFIFTPTKFRYISLFLVICLMGHKIFLLLPIWLSGVLLYKVTNSKRKSTQNIFIYKLGFVFSIVMLLVFKLVDVDLIMRSLGNEIWPFEELSLGSGDRYLSDYIVTLIVFMNFYCAYYLNFQLPQASSIKKLASYTFTLYLLHSITLTTWLLIFPTPTNLIINFICVFLFTILSVYILGNLTEHKKHIYANFFKRLLKSNPREN